MKRILISVILAAICLSSFGQQQEEKKKFQIKGQPIVTVFANYHAGLGRANKESGFALDRAYLGYQFSLTEKLSGKVVFDMGSTKVSGSDVELEDRQFHAGFRFDRFGTIQRTRKILGISLYHETFPRRV